MGRLVFFLVFLWTGTQAQQSESYSVNQNFLRSADGSPMQIARSDEHGRVVWIKDLEMSMLNIDDGQSIVAAEAVIKNGKVLANPGDYEYWMVKSGSLESEVYVYPTLCTDNFTVFAGADGMLCKVFDARYRLLDVFSLMQGETRRAVQHYESGIYFVGVYDGNDIKKITKIAINK